MDVEGDAYGLTWLISQFLFRGTGKTPKCPVRVASLSNTGPTTCGWGNRWTTLFANGGHCNRKDYITRMRSIFMDCSTLKMKTLQSFERSWSIRLLTRRKSRKTWTAMKASNFARGVTSRNAVMFTWFYISYKNWHNKYDVTEQWSSSKSSNSSASQEIPRILRKLKIHYRVHKSSPLLLFGAR
jgi:hypothetical protein